MPARYCVLIPFYRGDDYRERSLQLVIRHCWESSYGQCRIVVSEQNSNSEAIYARLREEGIPVETVNRAYTGRFNKSRAWNDGIEFIAKSGIDTTVLLLDCDIIVESQLLEPDEIDLRMSDCRVWHPFDSITDLDRYDSHIVCNESFGEIMHRVERHKDRARRGHRCYGGALFIKVSDYLKVGGYDVRYDAWGHEDDAFYYACRVMFRMGCRREHDASIYHVYHPIQNTTGYLKGAKYRQLATLKLESVRKMKSDIDAYCKSMRFSNALFHIKLK